MNENQRNEVINCLVEFVKRVASDRPFVSPAQVAALPEIARILLSDSLYDRVLNISC